METKSEATKILVKGPEYLRKQMELESETKGRMSAVERLAASKPKYVKSQQVVNSTQEPVSLGSASASSPGSSNQSSNPCANPVLSNSEPKRVAQLCPPGKGNKPIYRKRQDSLLLYRQKCDLLQAAGNDRKHLLTHKLQLSSVNRSVPLCEVTGQECKSEGYKKVTTTPGASSKECGVRLVVSQSDKRSNGVSEEYSNISSDSGMTPTAGGLLAVPEVERRSGNKVGRSHSDISSRYSKNFADFDAFFKYCGLDGEVIESLGRENFSARSDKSSVNIRSVSISTSDDGFSRESGDSDRLLEDELVKKSQQGTSVIERNARIIKWLYSCRNAAETGKKLRDLD
uniref:Protein FAM110C n=1 Tax=Austrofundulus limnaeus TaxID=52670 RepID=A0A2I4BGX1_AUSLI